VGASNVSRACWEYAAAGTTRWRWPITHGYTSNGNEAANSGGLVPCENNWLLGSALDDEGTELRQFVTDRQEFFEGR
jgi:hypothetical protein